MSSDHDPMGGRVRPILVNYNRCADTLECLASLRAQQGITAEPIVVDNGSTDDSVSNIRAAFPGADLLVNESNLGFVGGNNVGIERALDSGAEYLFLVNNDTVLEPDCLSALLRCAKANPDAAVVGPAIYEYAPCRPWFTGSSVSIAKARLGHSERDVRAQKVCEPYEVPWYSGCAMLIPATRIKDVGRLDARYFCYYEDADWCFRARRLGYRCLVCPTAILYHKVGQTAALFNLQREYYAARNRMLFFAVNTSGPRRWMSSAYLNALFLRTWLRTHVDVPASSTDQKRARRAALQGYRDFYRKRFGVCPHVGF